MAKTTNTTQTTKRNPETTHAVQHFEIVCNKPTEMRKFLEKQFGWTFETNKMPGGTGDYHSFRTQDGNGGGVLSPQAPTQPIAVTPYINVENCEASEKACRKNGATIIMPTTEVPGMGKFFQFQYAGGPPLACWQANNTDR